MFVDAVDLKEGDVWIGETASLTITGVYRALSSQMVVPWDQGRESIPIPMRMVIVFGRLDQDDRSPFTGSWLLQPDQPVEIRRG